MTRILACLATGLLLASTAFAVARADTLGSVLDATLRRERAVAKIPGIAAVITRNGAAVWSGHVGVSAIETGQAFQRDTLSSVASVTKPVTATIVLRLVEEGLLSLDGPIAPYVPRYIPAASQVTIRQLLGMTSGYNDTETLPAFDRAAADPNHRWTRNEVFKPLRPPHFKPGSQVEYNNTNFVLLSAIVDHAYPGGMAAAYQKFVGRPAKLGRDAAFTRERCVADRFAHGYLLNAGRITRDVSLGAHDLGVNTSVWGTFWGDGGLGATADGLARFADALFAGRLVRPATLAAMEAPLLAGASQGLGLQAAVIDGHLWFGHSGAFNGYTALLLHDPARHVTLAGVANGLDEASDAEGGIGPALIAAYDAYAGR